LMDGRIRERKISINENHIVKEWIEKEFLETPRHPIDFVHSLRDRINFLVPSLCNGNGIVERNHHT
jgi:hypothetical protein